MINKKGNSGITLIALVVTIVVLLILAGITLNLVIGENGIITKAKDAREKYINSSIDEEEKMSWLTNELENMLIDEETAAPEITDNNPGDITKDAEGNSVDGTETNPFQINSIEDLVAFADNAENTADYYFILNNTLNFKSTNSYVDSTRTSLTTYALDGTELKTHTYDVSILNSLTTGTGWEPVSEFSGTFNGNENTLKNLCINYTEESSDYCSVGLFAVNNGAINDLNVTGNVTGTMKATYEATGSTWIELNVGAIAGDNYGTINKCNSNATVTGIEAGGEYNVLCMGGVTGYNEGNILNCSNLGNITCKSNNQTYFWSWLDVAGIAGDSFGGNIENCNNLGNIKNVNSYIGTASGIAGYVGSTTIKKCYNAGKVSAENVCDFIEIAGIVGDTGSGDVAIENCYNIGTIITSNVNSEINGGIVGYAGYFDNVSNNYDSTGIGAVGGQDFVGIAEGANFTLEEAINYINNGTHPASKTQTYAISDNLKPGVYVKYNTSSLADLTMSTSLTGSSNYTSSQTVKPSSYSGGWQVLSNDGTTVELISSDVITITNGYSTSYNNRLVLYGETGYKNAIEALNTVSGAFLNTTYANSARSVGSTSLSKTSITNTLQFKPTNYSGLTDTQFYKDFANMLYSNTCSATSNVWYWLASRLCYCDSGYCNFYVGGAYGPGDWYYNGVCYINSGGSTYSGNGGGGVRPIVSLKSDLSVVSGSGTASDPYVFEGDVSEQ